MLRFDARLLATPSDRHDTPLVCLWGRGRKRPITWGGGDTHEERRCARPPSMWAQPQPNLRQHLKVPAHWWHAVNLRQMHRLRQDTTANGQGHASLQELAEPNPNSVERDPEAFNFNPTAVELTPNLGLRPADPSPVGTRPIRTHTKYGRGPRSR